MSDDRKHVRVYYSIIDDPKFETVFRNDARLATWLRLLMVADAVWPASADIPRTVRDAPLKALVAAELVDALPNDRFRIHGLDAERGRRQDAAKNAAAKRWQSEGSATASPTPDAPAMQAHSEGNASKAKQSIEEQSRAERAHDPWDNPEQEALTWLAKHGCDVRPGNGFHRKLIVAVEHHGVNALIGMMDRLAEAGTKAGDTKGFLFGAIDALDAQSRPSLSVLAAEDREEERGSDLQRRLERTRRETAEVAAAIEANAQTKVSLP